MKNNNKTKMIKIVAISLIAVFSVSVALLADNIAMKQYKDFPSDSLTVAGIPGDWPKFEQPIGTNTTFKDWTVMTRAERNALKTKLKPTVQEFFANRKAATDTGKQNNIQALLDLFDTFQTAENNWTNLTTAQRMTLLRKHNQALLRLKPILKQLYENSQR